MFTRLQKQPKKSILLLGPRGTGKSTRIQQNFPDMTRYDLLNTREALRLSRDPSLLFQEVAHLSSKQWVVIDEVQKVPDLLDEVHRLIEEKRLNFILCGSSARKLKKKGTNLLAGRARSTQFFPLVSKEIGIPLNIHERLRYGMLPVAVTEKDPKDYLRTYAEVYLQEEIKGEALTQNIGHFARFLEVAARQNGQVTNVSGIARDAQVARQTVQGYFNILVDTLIGYWLEPWKLKRATKQIAHPKFYFFDSGVVRALSLRLPYPPLQEEWGPLLETFLLHEIRAYLHYINKQYPLYFWSSPDGVEVDVFLETSKGYVAIECKSSSQWTSRFNLGLRRVSSEIGQGHIRCFGVYLGTRPAVFEKIQIFPIQAFLKQLWDGDIIK